MNLSLISKQSQSDSFGEWWNIVIHFDAESVNIKYT